MPVLTSITEHTALDVRLRPGDYLPLGGFEIVTPADGTRPDRLIVHNPSHIRARKRAAEARLDAFQIPSSIHRFMSGTGHNPRILKDDT